MTGKELSAYEKLQQKKDQRQQQIKTLMDADAKDIEDKITNLRTAHRLDKNRIQSALSKLLKSK